MKKLSLGPHNIDKDIIVSRGQYKYNYNTNTVDTIKARYKRHEFL